MALLKHQCRYIVSHQWNVFNRLLDRRTDRQKDGQTDRQDGQIDGWTTWLTH